MLALLGPGAALAQNPGDEQYSDPLAPNEQPEGGGGGGDDSDSGSASGEESQAGDDDGTGSRGGASGELPRTGLPVAVMALLGAGMLASGAALRRRLS